MQYKSDKNQTNADAMKVVNTGQPTSNDQKGIRFRSAGITIGRRTVTPRRVGHHQRRMKKLFVRPMLSSHDLVLNDSVTNPKRELDLLPVEKLTTWANVKPKCLPFFPLERILTVGVSSDIVSSRITKCLYERSIHAIYDSDNAEVTCTTSSGVKFKIVLYENEDNDPNTAIVSILRVKGCSLAFNIERQAVTKAVLNDSTPCENHPNLMIENNDIKTLYAPPSAEEILKVLELAEQGLMTTQREIQLSTLGMLGAMTDPVKTHTATSHTTTKMMMQSHIPGHCLRILESCMPDDYGETIELAVLRILSNILSAFGNEEKIDDSSWLIQSVYPALVKELKSCSSPHIISLRLKCLASLFSKSSLARGKAAEDNLREIIARFEVCGERIHRNLYVEARRAIETLDGHDNNES